MKRLVLLVLCTILFSQLSFASDTKVFTDIKDDFWAKDSINYLVNKSIISGYPDGSFKPANNIKINEFIVMIIRSMELPVERRENEDWVSPYIRKAYEIGLLVDDQFLYNSLKLTSDLTREEMVRLATETIAITEGLPYPDETNQYYKYEITDSAHIYSEFLDKLVDAYKLGIVSGYPDGSFKPKKNVTRAEAAKVLVSVIEPAMRKPYGLKPYNVQNADSVQVPIIVYEDSEGKHVGFTYIWNREISSFYTLERNYDDRGNLVAVYGNGSRQYPTRIEYVRMDAPLYNGKPLNEFIQLTRYLYNNRDNGNGFLDVYSSVDYSAVGVSGFKSKEFLENVYIEEKHPTMQSIYHVERMDFLLGFNPFNSYEKKYLNEGFQPYDISIWKKRAHMGSYKNYGDYFIATYGNHFKSIFDILFEKESPKMWNEFVKGIYHEGDSVIINSTLNNRTYRLHYYYEGLSLSISLKK